MWKLLSYKVNNFTWSKTLNSIPNYGWIQRNHQFIGSRVREISTITTLRHFIDTRQPMLGLPRSFYSDQQLYQLELDHLWTQSWLFAGYAYQLPTPGSYITYQMGNNSLL